MITRTIIAFDDEYEGVYWLVVEQDFSECDRKFIGVHDEADVLNELLYNADGLLRPEIRKFETFPHDLYIPGQTAVIVSALA